MNKPLQTQSYFVTATLLPDNLFCVH